MRILITTFTYPPNMDGVAEASRHMAEGLARRGWDVTVATGHTKQAQTGHAAVRVERFDLVDGSSTDPAKRGEVERYREFVKCGGFDVVVNQCWDVWSTECLLPDLPALPSRKVMVSHGMGSLVYQWYPSPGMGIGVWLRGLQWIFRRLIPMMGCYNRLIFLSNTTGFGRFFDHTLARFKGHPGIEIVPNGVECSPFETADPGFRQRRFIDAGPLVLCVANYCERKNQKLALRVFREAAIEGATLVFIGSELGRYGRELLAEVDSDPKVRVVVLEKLSREETFSAFSAADAFLLAAKAETQPIVLIEAMAAGVPWVSTETGCVRDMPGGLTGRTPADLVAQLRRVTGDSELRQKLLEDAEHAVRTHYSAEATLAAYDRIFRSLLP